MAGRDDKEPIKSVTASMSLFEQKIDQQNFCLNSNEHKGKELDLLMTDLADCKLQLDMKDSAYMQAIAKLDVYQRTVAKLSTQLKVSEADRDIILREHKKSQAFVSMLESEYEAIIDQLVDCNKDREQLLRTVDDLKHAKEELHQLEAELAAVEESKVATLTIAELAEKALDMEKEKNTVLLAQVSELNEAILSSNLAAIEAEKVRLTFFAGMEAELQAATEAVVQSHEQLEQMKMQLAMTKDLGNELLEKTMLADYYQSELMQAKELLARNMELMQTVISDEKNYSLSIEAEAKRLDEELKGAKEKASNLKDQVDKLTVEIQYMKDVSFESNERELELQVEIAELKSEVHKNRSRIAAAEAAEARALSSQSGLHLAVQQLALEAETAKKEAHTLKLGMCSGITISVEEHMSLVQKAEMADRRAAVSSPRDESKFLGYVNKMEFNVLKEELDAANAEIGDLKFALEGSVRRAEMAENAKSAIEDQLRKWREKQKLRRAASEAAQEQPDRRSVKNEKHPAYDKHMTASLQDGKLFNYVPLGKILNMKF